MPPVECGCGKTYDDATQSVECPDHHPRVVSPDFSNASVTDGELRATKDIKAGEVVSIDAREHTLESYVQTRIKEALTAAKEKELEGMKPANSEQLAQAATQIPDNDGTTQAPSPSAPIISNFVTDQPLTTPAIVPPDATVQESDVLAFNGGKPTPPTP